MPSTSPVTASPVAGFTTLPGLKVSPYGAVITNLKAYDMTVTTSTFATQSTAFYEARYTVSGLTTGDVPFALIPSTAAWPLAMAGLRPCSSTAGGLNVLWGGNSTTATATLITNNMAATLLTLSYSDQASSTTT